MRINRHMRLRINHILANAITSLHKRIQVLPTLMHLHPSRVVLLSRRLYMSDQLHCAVVFLLVTPDPVRPHVCRVEVVLFGVEDHAVDGCLRAVLVVLDELLDAAVFVDGEDVAEAGMLVEGVAVDAVGGFFGGEAEDGAGAGVCLICFGWEKGQLLLFASEV